MRLRVPSYYKEFQCIADRCKDSCCIGWEIDIDEDTYEYYQSVEGTFGERLKSNMKSGKETSFSLKSGRCPFLNQKNLCDICIELGEEALCEVCTEYPRFTLEYGDVREKCLALSCEEVGRLVFENTAPFTYEEMEQEDAYHQEWQKDSYGEAVATVDEEIMEIDEYEQNVEFESIQDYEEDEEPSTELVTALENARDMAIKILQTRSLPIEDRINCYLKFCERIQNQLNENQYESINEVVRHYEDNGIALTDVKERLHKREKTGDKQEFFEARMKCFCQMEILDKEWSDAAKEMINLFSSKVMTEEDYVNVQRKFMDSYRVREYEYEHLCVYFTFRYFLRAIYDYEFLSKAKLAIVGFLCIRDMDVARYLKKGTNFTLDDRIDIARIYSKEVEHSEDNLAYLFEAFEFDEVFKVDKLIHQVIISPNE